MGAECDDCGYDLNFDLECMYCDLQIKYDKAIEEVKRLDQLKRDDFHVSVCSQTRGCHCSKEPNPVLKELEEL